MRLLITNNENVLMLGAGGTGKTEVIKAVRDVCQSPLWRRPIATTALTGCAALLIEGKTLHSWAGIKLAKESPQELVSTMKKHAKQSWTQKNLLLVIDEISMMSAELLDKLDAIAKILRRSSLPFGGLQVLASGDFLQLPPIKAKYCFKAACFNDVFAPANRGQLTVNFRQGADLVYQRILTNMRVGALTQEDIQVLRTRLHARLPENMPAMHVYPHRKKVEALNAEKMAALQGEEHVYEHVFEVDSSVSRLVSAAERSALEAQLAAAPCEARLVLKVGAVVMHVTNSTPNNCDYPKVNGSLGVVQSFDAKTNFPIVAFSDGDVCRVDPATWRTACKTLTRIQIPLIVAWAVTSHKIQGSTLDAAVMDIANCFELNQAYMIFARVKSLDGVFLVSFDPSVIKPCPEALQFYQSL